MVYPYDYFKWLCKHVCDERKLETYEELLIHLFKTPFTYILEMDANRISDGIDLRYRYGREQGKEDPVIASQLDIYPCNVLEVLVALSLRIENIMDNPADGNRTGYWFWMMMGNLSLTEMTNRHYDEKYVDDALYIFMNREYQSDGSGGGLVILKYPRVDMRFVEIWDQINWYLTENYI